MGVSRTPRPSVVTWLDLGYSFITISDNAYPASASGLPWLAMSLWIWFNWLLIKDIGVFELLIFDLGFLLFPSQFSVPLAQTVNSGISIVVGISQKDAFFRQSIGHTNMGNLVNLGGKGHMVFTLDVSPFLCVGAAWCLKILEKDSEQRWLFTGCHTPLFSFFFLLLFFFNKCRDLAPKFPSCSWFFYRVYLLATEWDCFWF